SRRRRAVLSSDHLLSPLRSRPFPEPPLLRYKTRRQPEGRFCGPFSRVPAAATRSPAAAFKSRAACTAWLVGVRLLAQVLSGVGTGVILGRRVGTVIGLQFRV